MDQGATCACAHALALLCTYRFILPRTCSCTRCTCGGSTRGQRALFLSFPAPCCTPTPPPCCCPLLLLLPGRSDVNLWPEDLPPGTVVMLGGADDLMASEVVRDALLHAAPHATVVFNPHLFHGAFLFSPSAKRRMLFELRTLLARQLPCAVEHTPSTTFSSGR
jgi:hypothetical protein